MNPRNNRIDKRLKIEAVKMWINKLTTCRLGADLLAPYNGDELDKMTLKEITMLLDYIRVTYHVARTDERNDRKAAQHEASNE